MDRYYANISEIDDAITTTNNIFETDLIENQDTFDTFQTEMDNRSNILKGPAYEKFNNKMEEISGLIEERNKVCTELQENIINSLTEIKTYMDPYVDLDTDDLPELETRAKQLMDYIASIKEKMEETRTVCEYDKDGNIISSTTVYVYDRAALQEVLDAIQPVLDEVNALIDKTKGLQEAVDRAQSFSDENAALLDEYAVDVEGIATGFVAFNSGVSGVIKTGENLVDGAVWVGASTEAWFYDLYAKGLRFIENHTETDLKSDFYKDKAEEIRTGAKEFIAKDYTGMLNDDFYNNTSWGRMLNEQSKYSYDSEYMQNIQDTSKNITTGVAEVALGLVDPGLSAAFGTLTSIGDKAEEIYNTNQSATLNTGTGEVLLSGVSGGIEGYLGGNAGTEIHKIATANGGLINGAKTIITDSINNARTTIATQGFKKFAVDSALAVREGFKTSDVIGETILGTVNDVIKDNDYSVGNIGNNLLMEAAEQGIVLPGTEIGKILSPANDIRQALGEKPIISSGYENLKGAIQEDMQNFETKVNNGEFDETLKNFSNNANDIII